MKQVVWTTVLVFLLSFGGTVGLHYYLQPPTPEPAAQRLLEEQPPLQLTKPELNDQQDILVENIERLETEVDRIRGQHSLAQARAQTLMDELDRYQAERDAFLAAYEERKSDIEDRLAELDQAIADRIAEQQQRQAELSDLDAQYRLDSMLAYPHPLNDSDILREQMRAHPRQHLERVQRHYQIILQAPDYPYQEQLYDLIEPVLAQQNDRYQHNAGMLALQCSARFCEVQFEMERPDPFVDYWRALLDALREQTRIGPVEDELVVEEEGRITGMLMVRRVP
ncbi:hypothetical protein [Saccharospirillum salsuginis]|uniref:Uncharacterized protein n=1 Tax=Saccharospirillum salsuginis TaxID=418750 RepID=A0A918N724_9GAMM|nr:hypothetical protein [Saccharospirillum salsuginis]GGX41966.1 hypothetical protein GCM10007392_06110 [Saccharospirillum salsuginis]